MGTGIHVVVVNSSMVQNEFELAPGGAYSDQNIYGNGLYTTDDAKTAAAYRRKNKGKGSQSEGVIYEVPQRGDVRLYDLDQPASAEVKQLVRSQSDYYSRLPGRCATGRGW